MKEWLTHEALPSFFIPHIMMKIELNMEANPSCVAWHKLLDLSVCLLICKVGVTSPEFHGVPVLNKQAHEKGLRPNLIEARNKRWQNSSPKCLLKRPTQTKMHMKYKNKFLSLWILHLRNQMK